MGNNPKTMYMLGFITCYSGKTLNCYKKYYHIYMKTKRNKKQKNRSFRKNRSFKKKGLKKNHTRKNVGGHLMGFEVGREFEQPATHFLGGTHRGIDFRFTAHSFKHIDTFENETYPEHESIEYPICEANGTGDVLNCRRPTINENQGSNLSQYNDLAQRMFRYMGNFLNMDTVYNWFHDETVPIAEKTGTLPANRFNIPVVDNKKHSITPGNRKYVEVWIPNGRKIHLSIEKVFPAGARPYLLIWEFSQKDRTSLANSETGYFTGNNDVYPSAKFDLIVLHQTSERPIDVVIGTPIDIRVQILNTVKSYTVGAAATLVFGNVEIYNTTNGVITAPRVFRRDVTNTNQIFNYNPDAHITSLRIVANIRTYFNQTTTKTQDINITPLPPPPPPDDLSGFTFGDATLLANSPNKNVVGTRVAADNGRRILIEKWRIGENNNEDKLGEYPLEPAHPSINIDIDPTKHIELRAYAIDAANVKSNGYEARDYEFDYIKSADIAKAVQGISTFTSTRENPITHVVNRDMITIRVNFKIINKRLLFFYCYAPEENNEDYVFDRLIENGQPTLDFQISTSNINNKFVKFLFYMKEGAGQDIDRIDRTDLSSYKELIIPLLSADARGENENDVKCVISGNTQNAISAQLKQNGEEKGNQTILENNQTYRFNGLDRGLGDAANSYSVTVNGNNERKIILPVRCNALEGEAAQRAEQENRRIAAETAQLEVDANTARTAAETARLENFCDNCEWKGDKGKVKLFSGSLFREMKKIVSGESKVNKTKWSLEELQKVGVVINNTRRTLEDVKNIFKSLNLNTLDIDTTSPSVLLDILKCIKSKVMDPQITTVIREAREAAIREAAIREAAIREAAIREAAP